MSRTPDTDTTRRNTIIGGSAVVAVAVLAFGAWFFVIRDTSPASVDTVEAAEARADALSEASDQTALDPAAGLDGTWTIDTSIGTFDETCLTDVCDATFVGFRINEELATLGAKTVVGRSPAVTGSIEISGSTITSVDMTVDMTQLITDDSRRTGAIRNQAIETGTFPEASFTLTEAIDLGSLPEDGEPVSVSANGDFTIHGVTRAETIDLTAEISGGVIVIFGQLGPILLADYNIAQPSAAIVLSVEDNATMELQLFLTR